MPSIMTPVNIWDTFQGAEESGTHPGLVFRDTFIRSLLAVVICHLSALRLVFTSDGVEVGVVVGVIRELMT